MADGAIHAQNILIVLIEDGLQSNRGFAGLPITQDQLALTASDRDQCVNHLDAGLQGGGNRCPIHDVRGWTLNRQPGAGQKGPKTVQRLTRRVDDTTDQAIADRYVHHMPTALDLIASVQLRVVTEQHDADFVLVDIEGDAMDIAWEFHQFLEADTGQAGDLGDAGRNAGDPPDFLWLQLMDKAFPRFTHDSKGRRKDILKALDAHVTCPSFRGVAFTSVRAWTCSFVSSSSLMPFSMAARYSEILQATFCPAALSSIPLTKSGAVSK